MGSDDPAIGTQRLAVDPDAVPSREEGDRRRDVLRLAEPLKRGRLGQAVNTSLGLPSRNSLVAVGPGAIALTVMLRPRSSLVSTLVIASTAALVAA
jgi:hypothetical protein